jgi:hypothetical protein
VSKKKSQCPCIFRILGEKVFELVNHLGNILSTISDRKLMHEDLPNNAGYIHHYTAEILSVQEQYLVRNNEVEAQVVHHYKAEIPLFRHKF